MYICGVSFLALYIRRLVRKLTTYIQQNRNLIQEHGLVIVLRKNGKSMHFLRFSNDIFIRVITLFEMPNSFKLF